MKITLLVVLGIATALTAFFAALALSEGETAFAAVFGVSLVLYLASFVGVLRDQLWGYWVGLVIGVLALLDLVMSIGSGGGGSFLGFVVGALCATRLFNPKYKPQPAG